MEYVYCSGSIAGPERKIIWFWPPCIVTINLGEKSKSLSEDVGVHGTEDNMEGANDEIERRHATGCDDGSKL